MNSLIKNKMLHILFRVGDVGFQGEDGEKGERGDKGRPGIAGYVPNVYVPPGKNVFLFSSKTSYFSNFVQSIINRTER